jgi:hypothetical protein
VNTSDLTGKGPGEACGSARRGPHSEADTQTGEPTVKVDRCQDMHKRRGESETSHSRHFQVYSLNYNPVAYSAVRAVGNSHLIANGPRAQTRPFKSLNSPSIGSSARSPTVG